LIKKIAITGASGFVGKAVSKHFVEMGDEIVSIGRDDFTLEKLVEKLEGVEVIINLAGSPIVKKWSEKYKKELIESRVNTTKILVEAISKLEEKPTHLISTSAVGIYNNIDTHTEESINFGNSFLSNLCINWESEAKKAEELGVMVTIFRFGVVLGNGGALKKMLPPFKMGVGGKIGSGKQAVSFIHIEDLLRAYFFVIEHELSGVFNLATPQPTTNLEMTQILGKVLRRPTLFPVPEFVVKKIFGDGARVLIDGEKMVPERLLEEGFEFKFNYIEEAIIDLC
jgi:uncharacterized protein (TIGR01777 family)